MQKIFISHSKKDKEFISNLLTELSDNEKTWIDLFEISTGDSILDKIEEGIDSSPHIIIILSKNSINSNWVKIEANLAFIKKIEDDNYKIHVIRIDDCEIPLRFKPYLFFDAKDNQIEGIKKVKEIVMNSQITKISRRKFFNRNEEINLIEQAIIDEEIRAVVLTGLVGIGKYVLTKEALKRFFHYEKSIVIDFQKSSVAAKIVLEFYTKVGLELPPDNLNTEQINYYLAIAIETIFSRNQILILNNCNILLDHRGKPTPELEFIIEKCISLNYTVNVPIFILSSRIPDFSLSIKKYIQIIRLKKLKDIYVESILKNEILRIEPGFDFNTNNLKNIVQEFHGYPLAAKIAAPQIQIYSVDFLLKNLKRIVNLKVDIAEALLANIELTDNDRIVTDIFSIINVPIAFETIYDLFEGKDIINEVFEKLVNYNLIEMEGKRCCLHPIVKDFFWKQARLNKNFDKYIRILSNYSKKKLSLLSSKNPDYIYWLMITVRMLYLNYSFKEAYHLRNDLIVELRSVVIDFYQKQDYEKSLRYCNEYLVYIENDYEVLFYKARSLSRLGKIDESMTILDHLLKFKDLDNFQKAKLFYAKGRIIIENRSDNDEDRYKGALDFFNSAIALSAMYSAPLLGCADIYFKEKKYDQAKATIEKVLDLEPMDPFALSLYAEILWELKEYTRASEKMATALTLQPHNHNFLFRMGKFYQYDENHDIALEYYYKAIKYNPNYYDAYLSIINILIDQNKFEEAESKIHSLEKNLKGFKQNILFNIKANYELKKGNIDQAKKTIEKCLKKHRDAANLMTKVKILLIENKFFREKNFTELERQNNAIIRKEIEEILKIEPDNEKAKKILDTINSA